MPEQGIGWENLLAEQEPKTRAKLTARNQIEGAEEERIKKLSSKFYELAKHQGLRDFLEANGPIVLASTDGDDKTDLILDSDSSITLHEAGSNDDNYRYKSNDGENQPEGYFNKEGGRLEQELELNKKWKDLTAEKIDEALTQGIQDMAA